MFRLRRMGIDTLSEHVIFIAEQAVAVGALGFKPLDRVRVIARRADGSGGSEVSGVLNFCLDGGLAADEIGLSEAAFRDLGLPEGAPVEATHTRAPESVERVRRKLRGERLSRRDFDAILADVCARRYAKPELSMFVLACALRRLEIGELVAFTEAMIDCGSRLEFAAPVVADKHCIGGIPGNRTTLIVVPILAALGLTVPKTSSRAITSPSGTADTMAALADVALSPERIRSVVERAGACIVWGGALDLAPADDVLITVERPMGIDSEGQMIASILSKKKTAGATHALIDIPVGPTAKVRSREQGEALAELFRAVARAIALEVDVVLTEAHAPIGRGVGPRLEALDVLAVLKREPAASSELREKSLYLAARLLECTGTIGDAGGYRAAQQALDSGAALAKFEEIVAAQGEAALPPEARFRAEVVAKRDGRVREIDCFEINSIAKLAGAPANPSAGLRVLRGVDAVVARGEPLLEVHAQSRDQLEFALEYAEARPGFYRFGF
ncbi:MAG: thymidine phosphorylase family protein [Myxococcota bacterium]